MRTARDRQTEAGEPEPTDVLVAEASGEEHRHRGEQVRHRRDEAQQSRPHRDEQERIGSGIGDPGEGHERQRGAGRDDRSAEQHEGHERDHRRGAGRDRGPEPGPVGGLGDEDQVEAEPDRGDESVRISSPGPDGARRTPCRPRPGDDGDRHQRKTMPTIASRTGILAGAEPPRDLEHGRTDRADRRDDARPAPARPR